MNPYDVLRTPHITEKSETAPDLAARILAQGESGLLPLLSVEDRFWVVIVERREGGFPEVVTRVRERVRDEALAQRREALLATLRSDPAAGSPRP